MRRRVLFGFDGERPCRLSTRTYIPGPWLSTRYSLEHTRIDRDTDCIYHTTVLQYVWYVLVEYTYASIAWALNQSTPMRILVYTCYGCVFLALAALRPNQAVRCVSAWPRWNPTT